MSASIDDVRGLLSTVHCRARNAKRLNITQAVEWMELHQVPVYHGWTMFNVQTPLTDHVNVQTPLTRIHCCYRRVLLNCEMVLPLSNPGVS